MEERDYWLGFSVFSGIGPYRFKKLLAEFNSAQQAWGAELSDLQDAIGERTAEKFVDFRKRFSINGYLKKLKKANVWFITSNDPNYPKLLLEIPNPPFVIFGRGLKFAQLQDELKQTIGIVGSRNPTNYGREVTQKFSADLALSGFIIISGLALGIDGIAHESCLKSGGKTIAVLGCGVDCCTPMSSKNIYDKIIKGRGSVISEVPLSYLPGKGLFPQRNRIIAGLSQAVLVTEGAEDSGSLITADFAFKFGRRVFAVPGPINSQMSKGPYRLINKGAKLATSAENILSELKFRIPRCKSQINPKSQITKYQTDSKEELKILKVLENEELYFDEIARKTKIDTSKLGSILSMMEIRGVIKEAEGKFTITS